MLPMPRRAGWVMFACRELLFAFGDLCSRSVIFCSRSVTAFVNSASVSAAGGRLGRCTSTVHDTSIRTAKNSRSTSRHLQKYQIFSEGVLRQDESSNTRPIGPAFRLTHQFANRCGVSRPQRDAVNSSVNCWVEFERGGLGVRPSAFETAGFQALVPQPYPFAVPPQELHAARAVEEQEQAPSARVSGEGRADQAGQVRRRSAQVGGRTWT